MIYAPHIIRGEKLSHPRELNAERSPRGESILPDGFFLDPPENEGEKKIKNNLKKAIDNQNTSI